MFRSRIKWVRSLFRSRILRTKLYGKPSNYQLLTSYLDLSPDLDLLCPLMIPNIPFISPTLSILLSSLHESFSCKNNKFSLRYSIRAYKSFIGIFSVKIKKMYYHPLSYPIYFHYYYSHCRYLPQNLSSFSNPAVHCVVLLFTGDLVQLEVVIVLIFSPLPIPDLHVPMVKGSYLEARKKSLAWSYKWITVSQSFLCKQYVSRILMVLQSCWYGCMFWYQYHTFPIFYN